MQIGFQRRFDAGYRAARMACPGGTLGTPARRTRSRRTIPTPPPEAYIAGSGGIFRDLHIHDFDALRFVTGEEIVEVYADGAVRETPVVRRPRRRRRRRRRAPAERRCACDPLRDAARSARLRRPARGLRHRRQHRRRRRRAQPDPLARAGRSRPAHGAGYGDFMQRFEPAYQAELAAFVATVPTAAHSACTLARGARSAARRARRRPLERGTAARRNRRDRPHTGHRGLRPSPVRPDKEETDGHRRSRARDGRGTRDGALPRRGLFVSGGLLAAGLDGIRRAGQARRGGVARARRPRSPSSRTATPARSGRSSRPASTRPTKDMKARGVNVTQVYANNDVSKQVSGINAAIASKVERDRDLGPGRERAQGSAHEGVRPRASRSSRSTRARARSTACRRTRCTSARTRRSRARAPASSSTHAGAKSVVVVIHEASNSGLTDRAKGVKKTFKGTTKTLLIPNAKADIPGTQAKIKAYFAANKSTDALLGLDPDVTVPAHRRRAARHEGRHVRRQRRP